MNRKQICVFDTETGGVGIEAAQKWSIFQLGAVVWDNGTIMHHEPFNIYIKEPDIVYQPEAMQVNGIDLNFIDQHGVSPAEAALQFTSWLYRFFPLNDLTERITLLGHNVGYDVSYLQRLWRLAGVGFSYDDIFNYRTIDTASIARYLIDVGLIQAQDEKSQSLFEHFGCMPTKPHDALEDAIATARLYGHMIEIGESAATNRSTLSWIMEQNNI